MEIMRARKIAARWCQGRLSDGSDGAKGDCQGKLGQTPTTSLPVTNHLHPGTL